MFLDEARIAAHARTTPTSCRSTTSARTSGTYFIAMEYLHGEDLRTLMQARCERRGERAARSSTRSTSSSASCAGLHYAHEQGRLRRASRSSIVHRDVSPQNMIVTYEGGVKLLDFGIAKAANRMRRDAHGTLKGKVPYMSPEQCRGEPLDRRSDIFSLGIVLYELTLGQAAVPRARATSRCSKQIVEGTIPPPRRRRPELSARARSDRDARAREGARASATRRRASCRRSSRQLVRERRLHVSPMRAAGVHGATVRPEDRGVARGAGAGQVARRASARRWADGRWRPRGRDAERRRPTSRRGPRARRRARWRSGRAGLRRAEPADARASAGDIAPRPIGADADEPRAARAMPRRSAPLGLVEMRVDGSCRAQGRAPMLPLAGRRRVPPRSSW